VTARTFEPPAAAGLVAHRVSSCHHCGMPLEQPYVRKQLAVCATCSTRTLPTVDCLPCWLTLHQLPSRWRGRPERTPTLQEVIARYGPGCHYCPAPATTVDHVLARSRGGSNAITNLRPACQPCNSAKADGPPPCTCHRLYGAAR